MSKFGGIGYLSAKDLSCVTNERIELLAFICAAGWVRNHRQIIGMDTHFYIVI